MDIHEIKFIKGAYGYENLLCCAFSSKAGRARKSFINIINYLHKNSVGSTWIAIYIPKSSRKYREEHGLPDISRYEGYICGFQELMIQKGFNYNDFGIDERWDLGVPSKRIFIFKEPKIHIKQLFNKNDIRSFYSSATSSAAYELEETQQSILLNSVSKENLIEVKVQQEYLELYPKVLKRLDVTN